MSQVLAGTVPRASASVLARGERMIYRTEVLRRYLFIKLKPEFTQGLKLVQLVEGAEKALLASYGVQDMKVGRAGDEATRAEWDLCISLMYVSGVDVERAGRDTILRTFLDRFLGSRAKSVQTFVFEHDFERKGA